MVEAYRQTNYRTTIAGEQITIRVGKICRALDRHLKRLGLTEWAFLSAVNPKSQLLPPQENLRRSEALRARLRESAHLFLSGVGEPESGDWPAEESVLILGVSQSVAVTLAREFEQNAVVLGSRGRPARLVWCRG